ncbi:MAG: hypothetical protein AB1510_00825 [Bacillota bacterium]
MTFNTRRCVLFVGLGLCILIGSFFFAITNLAQADTKKSLYEELKARATKGDLKAKTFLENLEKFLKQQGKTFETMDEIRVNKSVYMAGSQVSVRGLVPFYLKIYHSPRIKDFASLNEYVTSRKQALKEMATRSPNRIIEVSISPSEPITTTQLWEIRDKHGLDVDEVYLDVLIDGKWTGTLGTNDGDAKETLGIDFCENPKVIEQKLRGLLCSIPPPPKANRTKLNPNSITFMVQHVKAKTVATRALSLQEEPAILLVDPANDLKDPFINEALDIRVIGMPHLYIIKRVLLGITPPPSKQNNQFPQNGVPAAPIKTREVE